MGQEIEHKFRVDVSRWRPQGEGVAIRQGYLSAEKDRVVRIRTAGPKAYLTVKGPGHISRAEFEYEIPFADASSMLDDLCLPGAIDKTRYKQDVGGHVWEIDVFHGDNEGLVVAEIELGAKARHSSGRTGFWTKSPAIRAISTPACPRHRSRRGGESAERQKACRRAALRRMFGNDRHPIPQARRVDPRPARGDHRRPQAPRRAGVADHDRGRAPRLRDRRIDRLSSYAAGRRPAASTEELSAVMAYLHQEGVNVVARGAGTSLAGGAIPQEDAVVIGVAKMARILDIDYANRTIRVQSGVTNLSISNAVMAERFFYAPDPSSQLACTIAGNIGMNSGGAHCLKYGVTTNNVLGVKMVLVDGTVVEIGGPYLDSGGLDLLGLVVGSEGQLGIVTEATLRILPMAEDARPVLFGFPTSEAAGGCVAAIIGAGIIPVAIEFMDKLAVEICEDFAHAGYPLDVAAMLIIESEGSPAEIDAELAKIIAIAKDYGVSVVKESKSAMETAAIWKGRKSAFGATGRVADYICMDGTIPTGNCRRCCTG